MRARERERFLRMNFTEKELEIRDRLYKINRNYCRWKMVITTEKDRKHMKEANPDGDLGYANGCLAYFSNYPENGKYIDTIYFNDPDEYRDIITLYEGLFYQLFDFISGERIGAGCLDPDSPVEEIRERIGDECGIVCKFCFWRGLLYDEAETIVKNGTNYYVCHNKKQQASWEEELKKWR